MDFKTPISAEFILCIICCRYTRGLTMTSFRTMWASAEPITVTHSKFRMECICVIKICQANNDDSNTTVNYSLRIYKRSISQIKSRMFEVNQSSLQYTRVLWTKLSLEKFLRMAYFCPPYSKRWLRSYGLQHRWPAIYNWETRWVGQADVYFKFNSILQETEAIRSVSTWICLIYTTASIKRQEYLLAKTEVMDKQYFRCFHSIHISNRLPIQLRTAERPLSILPLLYPVCSLYRILRGDIK